MKKLNFWCNKVLPTVYDDSLSYYEVLCKITKALNELAEEIAKIEAGGGEGLAELTERVTKLEEQIKLAATYPTELEGGQGVNVWNVAEQVAEAVKVASEAVAGVKTILMADDKGDVALNQANVQVVNAGKVIASAITSENMDTEIAPEAVYDTVYEPSVMAIQSETGKGTMSSDLIAELEVLPLKFIVYNDKRYICQTDTGSERTWEFVHVGGNEASGTVISTLTLDSQSGAWEVKDVEVGKLPEGLATYPTELEEGEGVNVWDAVSKMAEAVKVASEAVEGQKTILMTDTNGAVSVKKINAPLIGGTTAGTDVAVDAVYDVVYEPAVIAVESETGKGTLSSGLLAELEQLPLKYIVYNGKRYVCQSDTSEAGNWLFVNMGVADGSGVVSVLTLNSTSGAWEVAEVPFGNGGGGGDTMLTASTPEEMEALLTEENVGKVVKYTGVENSEYAFSNTMAFPGTYPPPTYGYPTYSVIGEVTK